MDGKICYNCILLEYEKGVVYVEDSTDESGLKRVPYIRCKCPISKDLIDDIFKDTDCMYFDIRKET